MKVRQRESQAYFILINNKIKIIFHWEIGYIQLRGVLRTLSNIYDGTFFAKIVNGY